MGSVFYVYNKRNTDLCRTIFKCDYNESELDKIYKFYREHHLYDII